jgi:hypothetical protein
VRVGDGLPDRLHKPASQQPWSIAAALMALQRNPTMSYPIKNRASERERPPPTATRGGRRGGAPHSGGSRGSPPWASTERVTGIEPALPAWEA